MSVGSSGFAWQQPNSLPFWLADEEGTSFQRTFGQIKDDALDLLKEAVQARYPNGDRPDALPLQGNDRLIRRAPPESDHEYATRLLNAHGIWEWGGTPTSMVNIFRPFGYDAESLTVVPNHQVLLDANVDWFSRYILLANANYWEPDEDWDATPDVWEDVTSETWDSTATIEDLDYVRSEVRTFKSPWSLPLFLGVQLAGAGGDGFWDQDPLTDEYDALGAVWEDTVDVLYFPLARVWEDESWLGGAAAWDDDPNDAWEDDPFVAPSTGWHIVV